MVNLGDLPQDQDGTLRSEALGVSADGTVVVGWATPEPPVGRAAFIWDEPHGMRELQEILEALGLDLTGWSLQHATDVSADGLTIVGDGVGPNGPEGWIATIPRSVIVPLPTAAWIGLAQIGLLLVIGRARRIGRRAK